MPLGPPTPDGGGPSMELISTSLNNDLGVNWQVCGDSAGVAGGNTIWATPGTVNIPSNASIAFVNQRTSMVEDAIQITADVQITLSNNNPVFRGHFIKFIWYRGFGHRFQFHGHHTEFPSELFRNTSCSDQYFQ